MAINIDREAVSKQIVNLKLKSKVAVTAGILVLAVGVWTGIRFLGPQATEGGSYDDLAKTFTFRINTELLDSLDQKVYFSPEELEYFKIYVMDNSNTNNAEVRIIELTGDNVGQMSLLGGESPSTDSETDIFSDGSFEDGAENFDDSVDMGAVDVEVADSGGEALPDQPVTDPTPEVPLGNEEISQEGL